MSIDSQQSFHSLVLLKGPGETLDWHQSALQVLSALGIDLHTYVIETEQMFHHTSAGIELDPKVDRILKSTPMIWKSSILHQDPKIHRELASAIRSALGISTRVVHTRSYAPFVQSQFPGLDLILIYEGNDYPYTYQEFVSSSDLVKSVQYHHRSKMEKLLLFSFDFVRHFHRKNLTCVSHFDRHHLSDTFFHHLFTMFSSTYPEIETQQMNFDEALSTLFSHPEKFDTIVMTREYGDIFDRTLTQIIGKKYLSTSVELGDNCSIFTYESFHLSNQEQPYNPPSHWVLTLIHMLYFIGEEHKASELTNSWLKTIEEGLHPVELCDEKLSHTKVSSTAFVYHIIENLGKSPVHLPLSKPAFPSESLVHTPLYDEKMGHMGAWEGTCFSVKCPEMRQSFLDRLFALSFDSLLIEKIVEGGKLVYPTNEQGPASGDVYQIFFARVHSTGPWEDSQLFSIWETLLSESWEVIDVMKIYSYSYESTSERGEFKAL